MCKNVVFLLLSSITTIVADAQLKQASGTFRITASLANWDSTYVLITAEGDTLHQDSVRHGKFEFSGRVNGAKEGNFIIKKNHLTVTLPLYIEPGEIHVQDHERNTVRFDISGTHHNDLFTAFTKQIAAAYRTFNSATPEEFQKSARLYVQQYIQNHKASLLTLTLFRRYILNAELGEQEKRNLFLSINKNIRNTYGGKEIARKVNQLINTSVGKAAPLFSLPDTANQIISLQQFRGKWVLLDFWASWCVPCRKENPAIKKVYEEYKEKGLVIVSVSLDSDKEKWLDAINHDGLTWVHVSDLKGWENAVAKQYRIESIPANLLINPAGVVIDKNLDGEALRTKLASVIKNAAGGK